jgi:hypothetical protein
VNVAAPATVVGRLEFGPAGLTEDMVAALEHGEYGALLVRGAVGALDGSRRHIFVVEEAYLGMPGITPNPDDRLYAVRCGDAACETMSASLLDTVEEVGIAAVDVARAAEPMVDTAWLADRVKAHGAVVNGHIRSIVLFDPNNPIRILEASQVHLRLRDVAGSCVVPPAMCFGSMEPVWTRNAEGCLIFDGCVEPRVCALVGSCPEGYSVARWATAGPTCRAFACEPSFMSLGKRVPATGTVPIFP